MRFAVGETGYVDMWRFNRGMLAPVKVSVPVVVVEAIKGGYVVRDSLHPGSKPMAVEEGWLWAQPINREEAPWMN